MILMLRFNVAQIDRLSELLANLSLVMLAAFVLPSLTQPQTLHPTVIGLGVIFSVGTAILSLSILKGVNK